jgi:hypothetical protein
MAADRLTDEELNTLEEHARVTPGVFVIGTAKVRDVLLSLVAEVRSARGAPSSAKGSTADDARLATALRLLASEHHVLRKVRLRETFTMEESQAASASWHETENFLDALAASPSPSQRNTETDR